MLLSEVELQRLLTRFDESWIVVATDRAELERHRRHTTVAERLSHALLLTDVDMEDGFSDVEEWL
eukprot:1686716-Amphidinium_carterae.2